MSTPPGKMGVLVGERCAFVKISGRANFNSSMDFKTLVNELLQKGYAYFVLDLTECLLMDSTFLGVLAGFALKMNEPQADGARRTLELFNPNPRITELLENLGVLHLFTLTRGEINLPQQVAPLDHSPSNPSREEVAATCLEAHRVLMNLHPDNVSRFKDVAAFLAEDLKRLKTPD